VQVRSGSTAAVQLTIGEHHIYDIWADQVLSADGYAPASSTASSLSTSSPSTARTATGGQPK
jgi:hypothetical protein